MLSWRIGEVKVTKVLEMEDRTVIGSDFLMADATPEAIKGVGWLQPHFADAEGHMFLSFHAFLVETPTLRILVDTCLGADKERGIPPLDHLNYPFLETLAEAGARPDDIDIVVCTHLHIDHVGWNTRLVDGQWVPSFPKSRYLVGRTEFEHWRDQKDDHAHEIVFADSVKPVFDAGLVELVEMDHRICDEVSLAPTPGHTPGHVSVVIRSKGEEAWITGDFTHHPCQLAHPDWTTHADTDPAAGAATRRRVYADMADRPVLMLGTHFTTPTAGRVVRDGDAYRLVT